MSRRPWRVTISYRPPLYRSAVCTVTVGGLREAVRGCAASGRRGGLSTGSRWHELGGAAVCLRRRTTGRITAHLALLRASVVVGRTFRPARAPHTAGASVYGVGR